jgi:hypothetical protein
MTTYRWRQNHKQNSNHNSSNTKQETYQAHASALTPRQPYTRDQRRDDLDDEYDDSLGGAALLSAPNRNSESNVCRKEETCEQLRSMSVVIV